MPNFLDSSLAALQRGYSQLYGVGGQQPVSPNPSGVFVQAPTAAAPVARNPEVGAPAGAQLNWERRGGTGYNEYHSSQGNSGTQYTVWHHPDRGWSVRMAQGNEYGPGLGPTHSLHGFSDRNTAMGVAHHTENVHGGRNPGLSQQSQEGAPIARNPEVGQPMGADNSTPQSSAGDPLTDYYAAIFGLPFIRRLAASDNAMPMSQNPEMGQTASGDDSSDGSGAGLLSQGTNPLQTFFQNLTHMFSGGNQAPQMNAPGLPTNVGIAQPNSTYESNLAGMGPAGQWPTGSTVVPGQYVLGPSVDGQSGEILATGSDAAATPGGGGGMSGGQMGASAIGAIGSGLSNIGKNISSTKATYNAPNIPLPKPAYFTPPTLAPNRNASF